MIKRTTKSELDEDCDRYERAACNDLPSFAEVRQAPLEHLFEKDKQFYETLMEFMAHLSGTFRDKYVEEAPFIDTKRLINHPRHAVGYNIGNAAKYLQRYASEGYEKSGQKKDLMKAAHYILMELNRVRTPPAFTNTYEEAGQGRKIV